MADPDRMYGNPFIRKDQAADTPAAQAVMNARNRSKKRSSTTGTDDILMLQSMLNQGIPAVDMASLQAELQKAIAGQYDPQIKNIGSSMANAKKRAGKAKADIGALYNDLASYYTGQVAPSEARTKQYKSDAKQSGDAQLQSITQDYTNRMKEQVNQYQNLGIEAAAPSAGQGQSMEEANARAVAQMTSQAEQSALDISGKADVDYWNQGAGAARTEGADQQAALTQQLNDYLNQQDQQLALLKGQKSSAYNQGLIQLQQQAAESAAQQQNQLWSRLLDLAKLKNSMAGSSSTPTKGLAGALNYLAPEGLSDTFQQYLAEANKWGNSAQGHQYYNGGQGPKSPEDWAQVIRDNAANKGLSPQQQMELWQAALMYYGRV